jgi:hypothetical protein
MLLTPARADDVTVAALNRAAVEANCPKADSRQNAVRATKCRMNATRPVLAEHAPATLPAFEKMASRNIASAKKFAAGQITGEQYMAEGKARAAEFLAETEQGRQSLGAGTAARTTQSHGEPLDHAGPASCRAREAAQSRVPALRPGGLATVPRLLLTTKTLMRETI